MSLASISLVPASGHWPLWPGDSLGPRELWQPEREPPAGGAPYFPEMLEV